MPITLFLIFTPFNGSFITVHVWKEEIGRITKTRTAYELIIFPHFLHYFSGTIDRNHPSGVTMHFMIEKI